MTHDPYREFRLAVERGADKIDLARAALTIALSDYPNLDIAGYLGRIDELAVEVTGRCSAGASATQQLAALNEVLFARHRFRGNSEDYYDPKNSFLNEVLDRRTGIPITLSILYIEVAQRVGLLLEGVGLCAGARLGFDTPAAFLFRALVSERGLTLQLSPLLLLESLVLELEQLLQ